MEIVAEITSAVVMEGEEVANLCIAIDNVIERAVTVSINFMNFTAIGKCKQLLTCYLLE